MDRSIKGNENMDLIEMEDITPSSVKRNGDESDGGGSSSPSISECCLTTLRTGKCLSTTSSVEQIEVEQVAAQPTPSSSQTGAVRTADKSSQTERKAVRFPALNDDDEFSFPEMSPLPVETPPPTPPLPPLTMNLFKRQKKVVLWNTRREVRNMNAEDWDPERQFFRRRTGIAVLNRQDICECMRSMPHLLQALETQQMPPMGSCEHAAAVATMRKHYYEERQLEAARCQLAQMHFDEDAAVSPPPPLEALQFEAPPFKAPPLEAPLLEAPPLEAPPFEVPPFKAPPFKAPPFEAPPFEAPPLKAPPLKAPPFEAPPFEAPPREAPPFKAPPFEAPRQRCQLEQMHLNEDAAVSPPPPLELPLFEAPPFEAPPLELTPLKAHPFEAPPLDPTASFASSSRCPGFKDIELNATQTVATIHYTTCDQVRYARRILEGIWVTGTHRLHIVFAYSDEALEDPKHACLYHLTWRASKMITEKKKKKANKRRRSIE